jgi:hypothetical protein
MKMLFYVFLLCTFLIAGSSCSVNTPREQESGAAPTKDDRESGSVAAPTPSPEVPAVEKIGVAKEIYMGPLKILDVKAVTNTVKKYEKYEMSFTVDGFAGNCFDPDQIDVSTQFVSPSGKTMQMPAFWYQEYKRELIPLDGTSTVDSGGVQGTAGTNPVDLQGQEKLDKAGEAHWRVRFSPIEKGEWKYTLQVKAQGVVRDMRTGSFTADHSDNPGYLRVEPEKKRRFVFDNSDPYTPIGENVAWWTSPTRGSYDYNVWYKKLADNGANFARVWMATWGFALAWNDTGVEDYTNRLDRAYQLDKMLEQAQEKDIYIMLTFLHHGPFSTTANAQWKDNPFNAANGGYLEKAEDFFTNEKAKTQFKKLVRYIVARWGYSTNIMSWELFNEVSWTDNYSSDVSSIWHKEMADYLRSIDPYRHMVSSSSAKAYDSLEKVRELDFVNIHDYGISKFAMGIPPKQKDMAEMYDKPAFFCEMGISGDPSTTKKLDPTGVHLHQGLWSGVMGGGAGTGMTWWWDSYVDPENLYYHFKPVSTYVKRIPWKDTTLEYVDDMKLDISDFNVGVHGYINKKAAYLWLYDKNFLHIGSEETPMENIEINLKLASGTYEVQWLDTYTGENVLVKNSKVVGGVLKLKSPAWKKDIALSVTPAE